MAERFVNIFITAQDFASNVFDSVQANADAFGESLDGIGDDFGELGAEGGGLFEGIGSSIAAATGTVFAMIAAFEVLGGVMRVVTDQFQSAMDLQVERVRATTTAVKTLGLTYEEAGEYVQSTALQIAQMGAETPTSGSEIQKIFLSIQDDYNLALRAQVSSLEELQEVTVNAATRMALLGDNIEDTRSALIAYLSGSVGPGGLDQYRFFGDNPVVRTELIRLLEEQGVNEQEPGGTVDSFGDVSLAQRVEFLNSTLEKVLTDRDIEELGKTAQSLLSNFSDRLFNEDIGYLSIFRDLNPDIAGYQSVFETFNETLDIILGNNGILIQFARIFKLSNYDVMEEFNESLISFNQYLTNFRDGLLDITSMTPYDVGKMLGNVIGDFVGAIRDFVLDLILNIFKNIPHVVGFAVGLLEGLIEGLIFPTIAAAGGFFIDFISAIPQLLGNILTTFGELFYNLFIRDALGLILSPFKAIGEFLGGFLDFSGMSNIFGDFFGAIGEILHFFSVSIESILFFAAALGVPLARIALMVKSLFDVIGNIGNLFGGGSKEQLDAIGGENMSQEELDAYARSQQKNVFKGLYDDISNMFQSSAKEVVKSGAEATKDIRETTSDVVSNTKSFFDTVADTAKTVDSFFLNLRPELSKVNEDLNEVNQESFDAGRALVDSVVYFFTNMPDVIKQINDFFSSAWIETVKFIRNLPENLYNFFVDFGLSLKFLLEDLLYLIFVALKLLFVNPVTSFAAGVISRLYELLKDPITNMATSMYSSIDGFLKSTGRAMSDTFQNIQEWAVSVLFSIKDDLIAGSEFTKGLYNEYIFQPISNLFGTFSGAIAGLTTRLSALPAVFYELFIAPFASLGSSLSGLPTIFHELFIAPFTKAFEAIRSAFDAGIFETIVEPVFTFFGDLFTKALPEAISALTEALTSFISDLFNFVTELFQNPVEAVNNLFFGKQRTKSNNNGSQGNGDKSTGFFESVGNFFGGLFGFGSAEGYTPVPIAQAITDEINNKPPGTDLVIANSSELIATPDMVKSIVNNAFRAGKASVASNGYVSQKAAAMLNETTALSAYSGFVPNSSPTSLVSSGNTFNFNLSPGTPQSIALEAISIFEQMLEEELDSRL